MHLIRLLAFVLFAAAGRLAAADVTDTVAAGTPITFGVVATGEPAPTFEWFRNGEKVAEGPTLELGPITADKAGTYTVKATNSLGSAVSDKYTLVIGSPPSKPIIKIIVTVTVTAP
jgi:hypothetical protein